MTVMFEGRKEDQRLLTGQGQFTADWSLPEELHAAFLRSDRAHAEILKLDVAAAKAAPGVVAVLTAAEMRAANLGTPPRFLRMPGRGGREFILPPRDVLAADRVRSVGQPIAMVVATSLNEAQDAVEQIAVEFRDLPAVVDALEAIKDGAPLLYPEVPNNIAFEFEFGNEAATAKIFDTASHVASVQIRNTRVITNPMEPNACIAYWNVARDRFELYRPTQGMNFARVHAMNYFGPPLEKYYVVAKDVGGSFGTRIFSYPEYLCLMVATKELGRPVKWVSSRAETFLADLHGRSVVTAGELAFDDDGQFLAVRYSWHTNVGCYPMEAGAGGHIGNANLGAVGPYRIGAAYGRIAVCVTNTGPVGAYRGAGRPEIAMNLEQLVDAAALKLGLDRFEIRRRNVIARSQFPYKTPHGITYDSGDHAALMTLARQRADWSGFPARQREAAMRGKIRGIGCSSYLESSGGFGQTEQTRIRFVDGGKVEIETPSGPSGQGHETTFARVISRALGIPYDAISVANSNPDAAPLQGMGSGGSRSAMVYGNALAVGANEVIRKGRPLAAEQLEVADSDLEFSDGVYRVKGTDLKIGLLDLAGKHHGALDSMGEVTAAIQSFPGGAHVAEVELDPATGTIDVVNYVAVDDCGTVVDHMLLEGQLLGGILQGIGQVIGEEAYYDSEGQLLTGSFMEYTMPRADLAPRIELVDHPVPSPNNPMGIKGVGETGTTGALTTTYSAVMDALRQADVAHMDMPFTPGRVWQAVRTAKAKS